MQIKTLLNHVEKNKSFVYKEVRLVTEDGKERIEVDIEARGNGKPICSGCGLPGVGYDRLKTRRFYYVPVWGIAVVFLYAMRRVNCPECGIIVERVPWAEGKSPVTKSYAWYLAMWARRLSWREVAKYFGTSWDTVYEAVKWAVSYGIEHRDLSGIRAIGIDEVAMWKGHKYMTVVYQIDKNRRRLLWIGKNRTKTTLKQFFSWFGEERTKSLRYVCSDMWDPYLKVVKEKAKGVIHILDRYHIVAKMNEGLDKVRREEARKLKKEGKDPLLKDSRWCILKRPKNLTAKQRSTLKELLSMNLKTAKAYLLKEEFQHFWDYVSSVWAEKFLDAWCFRTMRSRIEPMKEIARSLREHKPLLLNWFKAKGEVSTGAVEGFNNKIKVTARKSYGFKSIDVLTYALYHVLGDLPMPPITHKFC